MRSIIVTGASSGIGLATVQILLEKGYRVIGVARDMAKAKLSHEHFTSRSIDLSKLSDLPEALQRLAGDFTEVSGIVACAGQGRFGAIENFSYEQIRSLMDLNFTSQAFLLKAFMPILKQAQTSDVIFVGSESALQGGKYGAVYCASKFALRGFAQSLRKEGVKSQMRVCLVNPGMVRTPFFDKISFEPGDAEDNAIEAADVAETILSVLEIRRGTVVEEINLSPLKKVIQRKPKMS